MNEKKLDYYVVRSYSGPTAKKELWKVLSRPIKSYNEAETWLDFCKENTPNAGKYEFFIVTKVK